MKFYEVVAKLQSKEENKGYLIMVRCGIFYIGIGKDAVILTENFGLTPICIKEGVCKSGVPASTIGKFIKKVTEKSIAFKIYDYNKKGIDGEKELYKEILKIEANRIYEKRNCIDCKKCWYKEKAKKNTIENSIKQIENIGESISKHESRK